MNVRTDQETFGSYHPNDIKADITNYFNSDGEQVHSDNQWGLVLYNPNAAMSQYMGQLQEPGNLVPGGQNAAETGNQPNQQTHSVGFNPDDVNKQLMKTLQKSGYSSQNAPTMMKGDAGAFGFNPDAMNKELMASMLSHADQSQQAPAANQSGISSHTSNQNTNSGYGVNGGGYNADQVNAGLYSSMNYNPNSVNSASFNMASFSGSGNGMFSNTGASSAAGASSGNSAPAAGMTNAGTQSQNAAGTQSHNTAGTQSQNAAGGIKSPFQAGSGMASGSGGLGNSRMGSFNPFSSSQSGSGIAGQNDENVAPALRVSQTGLSSHSAS